MEPLIDSPEGKRRFAASQGAMSSVSKYPPAEFAETVEFPPLEDGDDSTNSTNSAGGELDNPPYPQDSILENWMQKMRRHTEAPDSFILGSVLPVCSAAMGRRVWIPFAGRKYPNLFTMIVARPGMRKSTSINPARKLAEKLLPPGVVYSGTASEEALFKAYLKCPDRLFIEDEGNTVLKNWADSVTGQAVSKRMLKLYDCAAWEQSYLRQEAENGDAHSRVDETSASMVLGATFNCCRFNGLDNRDGMQRRVNYYFGENVVRHIDWPDPLENFPELCLPFSALATLSGEFADLRESPETFRVWREIQEETRTMEKACNGFSAAGESTLAMLAEIPAKALKFAMIFEACRRAHSGTLDRLVIRPETLRLAHAHAKAGIEAFKVIQTIGERSEIRSEADSLLATIRTENRMIFGDRPVILSKTELTHRFAGNPGRKGARTPEHLYEKVIPDLLRRGLAKNLARRGNLHRFAFRPENE